MRRDPHRSGARPSCACTARRRRAAGCVRADGTRGGLRRRTPTAIPNCTAWSVPGMAHAFHARRHMHRYGTTSVHLGAVAVAQRELRVAAARTRSATASRSRSRTTRARGWWSTRSGCSTAAATPTAASCVIVTSLERARDLRAHARRDARHRHRAQHPQLVDAASVFDLHDDIAPAKATRVRTGGHRRRGRRRGGALRPVHDLGDHAARGVRLLRQGEGGPFVAAGDTRLRRSQSRRTPAAVSCRASTRPASPR